MPGSRAPMRVTRAAMFAAVCVALGAVGHSYISGADIPFAWLMGAFAATGGTAWLAAGRRRGPVAITAALLATQGTLHLVFSLSASRTPQPMPAHHHMPGMDMPVDAPGTAVHDGLGMIAAHALAGLFCAAWLAWGEAAVFRLAGALGATALLAARPLARALTLVRTRVAPLPAPPAHCPPYERPRRLRGGVHAHTVVRRGPPAGPTTRTTAPGRPARA
ncbi:hypothetical protein ACWDYJ_29730 [Streptomyces sp. NPDC003042]